MTIDAHGAFHRLSRLFAVMMLATLVACGGSDGEGSERPEDCRDDEYFDEGTEQCLSCPAVVEPECRPGCDVRAVEDSRECPVLECEEDCGDDGDES